MQINENLHVFLWQSMSANNCNTYFINGPKRILIDPGHRALFEHVERGLKSLGVTLEDIDLVLGTHGHPDHIEGVQLFGERPALFTLHESEWRWLESMGPQINTAFGIDLARFRPDFYLCEGRLNLEGIELEIIHTPGHSPGSASIYWPEHRVLMTGDVIFKEGLGRTDLPGGDGKELKSSIKRLAALDVERLLPGHGEILQTREEVRRNFKAVESFWFAYV
jgi:glyoxylase-like metal-dependent hydrolase (beta-lactamase superfamily II)